jgi:hypothetical protein
VLKILNFVKIRPVVHQLFHADRQTDMTKLTVVFHNFANASKNEKKQIRIQERTEKRRMEKIKQTKTASIARKS